MNVERGADAQPSLPLLVVGPVIQGFGRGSKTLGCPTGLFPDLRKPTLRLIQMTLWISYQLVFIGAGLALIMEISFLWLLPLVGIRTLQMSSGKPLYALPLLNPLLHHLLLSGDFVLSLVCSNIDRKCISYTSFPPTSMERNFVLCSWVTCGRWTA